VIATPIDEVELGWMLATARRFLVYVGLALVSVIGWGAAWLLMK
jgi:hypothetical protein